MEKLRSVVQPGVGGVIGRVVTRLKSSFGAFGTLDISLKSTHRMNLDPAVLEVLDELAPRLRNLVKSSVSNAHEQPNEIVRAKSRLAERNGKSTSKTLKRPSIGKRSFLAMELFATLPHEYELYLALNDIDHTKTKAKSPQTNGICERFHRTQLDEFYRIAFRKKIYRTLSELQTDLDEWLDEYNTRRAHQGKRCEGRTPYATGTVLISV